MASRSSMASRSGIALPCTEGVEQLGPRSARRTLLIHRRWSPVRLSFGHNGSVRRRYSISDCVCTQDHWSERLGNRKEDTHDRSALAFCSATTALLVLGASMGLPE